jgi:hypothetical protein
MNFFDLSLLEFGQVLLLCWCTVAVIGATSDRHIILGVRPPRFWFPSLQERAHRAVAAFEQILAVAEVAQDKHYSSHQLRLAVYNAHARCVPYGSILPWFGPRHFVEELEIGCQKAVTQLEAALAYEKTPAFLLEASLHLRQALESHPEKVAAHLQEIESSFLRRLLGLQEEKETAIIRAREHHVVVNQEIATQLGAIEANL